jgi:hopanoid biosynthesis associated RND transporter like protein HpnN
MAGHGSLVAGLVAAACRRARLVVLGVALLTVVAAVFVAARFSIHTELAALIPADVPWRVHEAALEAAFAEQGDDITVVIDGRTPELAQSAAARLTAELSPRGDLFALVERPGAGPYFDREGLLFLSEPEVRDATAALIRAQPLLAPAASDPSLRGVMRSLTTAADAAASGQAGAEALKRPLALVADATAAVEQGRPVFFSWRPLITGEPNEPDDSRQFVELIPKVDYARADPGEAGVAAVRAAIGKLSLDPAHGVRVRLTGATPMQLDELATLKEATGPIALLALAAVLAILYLAVRSPRIVAAILATVLAGLALTAAFGLALYGRFNLISVAFMPLFVGLGVDFAIQYCVRYRAEALAEPDVARALAKAGAGAGRGLTLAALATGLGFLAFLPTRYRGVSELGVIAGVGMGVAFALALTFLPALITLIGARSPAAEVGLPWLRGADGPLQARRRPIVAVAAIAAILAVAVAPSLDFNFDPLRLRDAHSESVATYLELLADPDTNPDALDVLTPNLAAGRRTAARLARTRGVQQVIDVDSLVPPDQAPKLALIQDANLLLDPTINPFDVAAPPSDADLAASLAEAATALSGLAQAPAGAAVRADAARLAGLLRRAAAGPPALRARLQAALVGGLPTALDQVRAMLAAEPVSLQTLPPELKRDWLTPDGRARVQVYPAGDPQDRRLQAANAARIAAVAPGVVGTPVAIAQTRSLILGAFGQAAALSFAAITLLLLVALRSLRAAVLTLVPILLTVLLTVATCVVAGQDINLENLIALPLLLGVGVSFNIYFVVAWTRGERNLLRSSLTRAVLYSALTTGVAFGALGLSRHPGTASMGVLLLIALFWTLVVTLVVQPALLGLAAGHAEDLEAR